MTHDDALTDYQAFSIDNSTRQLKTSAALDYETQSIYKLIVKVSDGRGSTDTINVTIIVTNEPETLPNNAPVFASDSTARSVTDVPDDPPNHPPVFALDSTTRVIGETTKTGVKIGAPVSATDPIKIPLPTALRGQMQRRLVLIARRGS